LVIDLFALENVYISEMDGKVQLIKETLISHNS